MPKNQLVFEIKASGTEFYIILDGKVDYYFIEQDLEIVKKMTEVAKKEPEVPDPEPSKLPGRFKSNYEGRFLQ